MTKLRMHRLLAIGKFGWVEKAAYLAIAIAVLGFTPNRREPETPAVPTAADIDRIDRGFAATGATLPFPTTITAPARDSVRVAILEGSFVTLAPGTTFIIGPKLVARSGNPVWQATINGAAHFSIAGATKTLQLHAATGRVALGNGTYDVRISPTALTVRTIAGADAMLYKLSGWKSIFAHHIHAGAVGGWEGKAGK